jgi:regulator of protease activity HflC (stomatin/prohibitin superfamily)
MQYLSALVWVIAILVLLILFLSAALRIVRPTQRGLVERFGKYNRFAPPGLHFMIPFVEKCTW